MQGACDASGKGVGGYFRPLHVWFFLQWQYYHAAMTIEDKELYGIVILAAIVAPHLRGKTIAVHCDNQGAVSKATRRPTTVDLVEMLGEIENEYDVTITVHYVVGKDNRHADKISRGRGPAVVTELALPQEPCSELPDRIIRYEATLKERYDSKMRRRQRLIASRGDQTAY